MAAKHDIQHGVTADLTVPRDDVLAACRRASEALEIPPVFRATPARSR